MLSPELTSLPQEPSWDGFPGREVERESLEIWSQRNHPSYYCYSGHGVDNHITMLLITSSANMSSCNSNTFLGVSPTQRNGTCF